MSDIAAKIGNRIREIRLDIGLTQEAVAFRAEVDRTFMNHVENGKRNVSIATLEKIVVFGLGKPLAHFFDTAIFKEK